MNELKFNSQVCTTKEQSQRLSGLGLKPETADMHHYKWSEGYWDIYTCPPRGSESCYIPAWSLHRLLDIIPNEIIYEDYSLILCVSHNAVYYIDDEYAEIFKNFEGNLYDCVVKCIEWLIKEDYFNKEYLKQWTK